MLLGVLSAIGLGSRAIKIVKFAIIPLTIVAILGGTFWIGTRLGESGIKEELAIEQLEKSRRTLDEVTKINEEYQNDLRNLIKGANQLNEELQATNQQLENQLKAEDQRLADIQDFISSRPNEFFGVCELSTNFDNTLEEIESEE